MSPDTVTSTVPSKTLTTRLKILLTLLALTVVSLGYWRYAADALPRLGATTTVTELNSGLSLEARVDTGAQFCSVHCEEIEIPSPGGEPMENVGKTVRFKIKGTSGNTAWIEAKLIEHAEIRTSTLTAGRYFVNLPLRVEGVEGTVLVNLNNRQSMRFPFLVGRNFLRDRFVVDVRYDNDDLEPY